MGGTADPGLTPSHLELAPWYWTSVSECWETRLLQSQGALMNNKLVCICFFALFLEGS